MTENKTKKERRYWLLKTEPNEWSWLDQTSSTNPTPWDGVKNKQAQRNLTLMRLHDLCFFYHTGRTPQVVGVVRVARESYGEGVVDVKPVGAMRRAVKLGEMKMDKGLDGFRGFKQPRLSVVDVEERVWRRVCEMGGGFQGDGNDIDNDNDSEERKDLDSQ